MAQYYAYKPRTNGSEPTGTADRLLFTMDCDKLAARWGIVLCGPTAIVHRYTRFYDATTFVRVV